MIARLLIAALLTYASSAMAQVKVIISGGFSSAYRQESLALCVEVGGADKVMYGSDYPHNIGDMKGCLKRVDALPDAQTKAVRSGNAKRIFKI